MFKTFVALYNGDSSNVVQKMLLCAVIHISDDLINVNAQVISDAQNGLAPFPVYSPLSIVGWNTHFLFRKWEMLASSIAQNSVAGVSLDACDVSQRVTSY
jgi:hypothetical protein